MSTTNPRGRFKAGAAIGASALALACAAPLQAQEATSADDSIVVTGERAVTATKTDTPVLRVPQAINIVTAEQIEDRGARSIIEALAYTAGVSNAGNDSRGDFNNVRGFESVLFLDGLKRNNGFVYLPRPDINTLERIEVLVGPASVLYGSGSSGGLTNMQSKRPKFEFGGSASVSYATFDRKEAVMDVTGPLSETVAVRLVALARDSDSLLNYIPDNRLLVQPAITWKPGADTEITAIGLYQHDENGPSQNFVPLAASQLAPPGRVVPASRLLGEPSINGEGHKNNASGTLLGNHAFSDALQFRSATRFTRAYTDYGEVYPVYPADPLNPFTDADRTTVDRAIFAYKVHYRTFNSDNNLQFDFATGPFTHKVLGGVDYSYFKQLARQAYGASTPIDVYNPVYGAAPDPVFFPQTRQVLKQLGFYVQDQIDFGEVASLVVGIRRDRATQQDDDGPKIVTKKTTKRAGLTVNVLPTLAPYLSYSESFLPISGLSQFGSSYQPLAGKQKEAGVKWQPRKGTMLRASYYDIKEDNALVPDPEQPLNSIQTGSTKSKGFEFQLDHQVVRDLTLSASYSHATSRVSGEGRQRDNLPKDLANIFATKTMELSEDTTLRFSGGIRYVGRQTAGDAAFLRIVTPSYTLVDAMAAVDYKQWSLQVNALNLFDHFYYATCSHFGYCSNGEQRTVQATLSYNF